jgi:hypothetical protein
MGLRTRSLRCAILVLVGMAIAGLPGTWSDQIPGSSIGPTLTWAGGTPDETLTPPPTPPQATTPKRSSGAAYATGGDTTTERRSDDAREAAWTTIWRVIRATMLRI